MYVFIIVQKLFVWNIKPHINLLQPGDQNFMICLNYYSIVSTDGLNESLNHKNVGLEAMSKSPFPTVQKQSKQMESIRWLSVLSLKISLKRNLLISLGTWLWGLIGLITLKLSLLFNKGKITMLKII